MKKRYFILPLALLIFIWFMIWIYNYLGTGQIIITTSGANNISLVNLNDASFFQHSHNKLSVKVKDGEYRVSVVGASAEADQQINVTGHKTFSYAINPLGVAMNVEPVVGEAAKDMVVGNDLFYIETSGSTLRQISSQNTINQLGNKQLQSVKWINALSGVGQDYKGRLYAIDDGTVKQINILTPYINYYAVSSNGTIYASYGRTIYRGTSAGNFTKLYSAGSEFTSLSASNGDVAIINSLVGDSTSSNKPFVIIVHTSGDVTQKGIQTSGSAIWSPDGKYLATTDASGGVIYDSSLNKIAGTPNSDVTKIVWLDSNRIAYVVGSQLWSFNLASLRSDKIAQVPLVNNINELAVSSDKAYLYLSLVDSANNSSIKRLGLRGQGIPNYIYQLQDVLPEALNGFSLSLVNFSHPTIDVQQYPGTDPGSDLSAASNELANNGFDLSKLYLKLLPPILNE